MVQDYWPSPTSMKAENIVLSTVAIFTLAFILLTLNSTDSPEEGNNWQIANVCLADHNSLSTHDHAQLVIVINGTEVDIESNIGIGDPDCNGMKGIHTHDNTGRLHIETPSPMPAPLGAFFEIWGESFSEDEIMGHKSDQSHEIILTVNGEVNQLYDEYRMQDGDQIHIEFREI
tara:strand:- start:273 stop:794 length:522 start_codon:yes stop_codon:yes gene_type:complete